MEIIETLNNKIDKLLYEHEKVKLENQILKQEIEMLKNDNDKLLRNNQDMFLRIDSTLTLLKVNNHD